MVVKIRVVEKYEFCEVGSMGRGHVLLHMNNGCTLEQRDIVNNQTNNNGGIALRGNSHDITITASRGKVTVTLLYKFSQIDQ